MHEGHRSRNYLKLKEGKHLYEHEILEILLYNAVPRKDTNPIAHALLARFPSISAILEAEIDELMTVEGVGEQVALYLKCIGLCIEQIRVADSFAAIKNRGELGDFVKMRIGGKRVEMLEIYAIDKNGKVFRIKTMSSGDCDKVVTSPDEIMKFITLTKPYSIVVAHNHTVGDALPSAKDIAFTRQVQLICSINNVLLYDHIICSVNGDMYSFFDSGRLSAIHDKFTIDSILKDGKRS